RPGSRGLGACTVDRVLALVSLDGAPATISVLLGNGDVSLRATPNVDMVATAVAVGDFNGDGIPDLAVVPGGFPLNIVSVLLGNGDGTFQAARNFATGAHSVSVAVGDFNRDGVPDLAVVTFTSS